LRRNPYIAFFTEKTLTLFEKKDPLLSRKKAIGLSKKAKGLWGEKTK
jgi:hypothetical protein